jgi:multidrug efflux pump subunit AcrB
VKPRRSKARKRDAILGAASIRLRPILMTMAALVLGAGAHLVAISIFY